LSIRKALRKVCRLPLKFLVLFLPGIGTVIFGELGHMIALGWVLNQYKTDFWPLPLYSGPNSFFPTYYFTLNYFLFLETASSCFLCNPQHNYNNSDTAGVSPPEEGRWCACQSYCITKCWYFIPLQLFYKHYFGAFVLFCSGSFTKFTVLVRICHL